MFMWPNMGAHCFNPRSFTLYPPQGRGTGSGIGVVLYQKGFYVRQGDSERAQELLHKPCYPTGGVQIGWDSDVAKACF